MRKHGLSEKRGRRLELKPAPVSSRLVIVCLDYANRQERLEARSSGRSRDFSGPRGTLPKRCRERNRHATSSVRVASVRDQRPSRPAASRCPNHRVYRAWSLSGRPGRPADSQSAFRLSSAHPGGVARLGLCPSVICPSKPSFYLTQFVAVTVPEDDSFAGCRPAGPRPFVRPAASP